MKRENFLWHRFWNNSSLLLSVAEISISASSSPSLPIQITRADCSFMALPIWAAISCPFACLHEVQQRWKVICREFASRWKWKLLHIWKRVQCRRSPLPDFEVFNDLNCPSPLPLTQHSIISEKASIRRGEKNSHELFLGLIEKRVFRKDS